MTIALRVAIVISPAGPHRILFKTMIGGIQLTHLALSLLINISATSLIALKAWCVYGFFGKHFVNRTLIDGTTRLYMQEIPQAAVGKWDWCPNPHRSN
jgi:hypothetical protein